MAKYGLHGKLKALEGQGNTLADILIQASAMVSHATGCHLYMVSKDPEEPDCVWVTEAWDSKEDHDNSLKNEDVRALISKAIPILDGPPQKGQTLEVLAGI